MIQDQMDKSVVEIFTQLLTEIIDSALDLYESNYFKESSSRITEIEAIVKVRRQLLIVTRANCLTPDQKARIGNTVFEYFCNIFDEKCCLFVRASVKNWVATMIDCEISKNDKALIKEFDK